MLENTFTLLGDCYKAQNEPEKALENYTDAILNFSKAIELDQNNDEALVQRGIAYHKVNNILAGCADFSRAAYLGNDEARVMLEAHCPH